ncbi:DUF2513 domain-containing protein [Enterococcus hirae]|uniref:DUF2513 domain-containing protein n=1 Tax=Enterococcus hirae TaxID=1354 RepID=UPI0019E81C51|nr:DUF2513 domain-containing protein [Enterococcus hirae]
MKLDHDLVRDILFFAEDLPYSTFASGDKIFKSERLKKYSEDQINYAITRLGNDDAQFIKGYVKIASGKPYMSVVSGLTFEGHQYLDKVRDPKVWAESKKISSKLASVSLDMMSNIASDVIVKMIKLN